MQYIYFHFYGFYCRINEAVNLRHIVGVQNLINRYLQTALPPDTILNEIKEIYLFVINVEEITYKLILVFKMAA